MTESPEQIRKRVEKIIEGVALELLPGMCRDAVSKALEGLLPDALANAVDVWHQSALDVKLCVIRNWHDESGKAHSPIPARQTDGCSGYDLVYCPPKSDNVSRSIRPVGGMGHPGYSVDDRGGVTLYMGCAVLLTTGIALAIPQGYEAQVRSRSGLACEGLVVDNSPGTVDSDYRVIETNWGPDGSEKRLPAEIKVLLRHQGKDPRRIAPGERIAQLVFCEVQSAEIEVIEPEAWGEAVQAGVRVGGFGSTGT